MVSAAFNWVMGWDARVIRTSFGPTRTTSPEKVSRSILPTQLPHLTVLRMQLDQDMTKRPIRNALDVRLPVSRESRYRRAWKLGQCMEVPIVDDGVYDVCSSGCECSSHQGACLFECLHTCQRTCSLQDRVRTSSRSYCRLRAGSSLLGSSQDSLPSRIRDT